MNNLSNEWVPFLSYLSVDRKVKLDGNNLNNYQTRYRKLSNYLGESQLSRDSFNNFIQELQTKKYTPSYINSYIKLAKHIDRFHHREELKDYTYFKEFRQEEIEALTPNEIVKLAKATPRYRRRRVAKKLKMRCLILLLGTVGSRLSETLALRWEDVSQVPCPVVYFREETTKSGQGRYCPIPKALYTQIMALPRESDKIFHNIAPTCFNKDLKLRAKKCNITKPLHAHIFRHSSITNKLKAGMPIFAVSKFHGHASTDTTFRHYAHLMVQELADICATYDPFFKTEQTFSHLSKRVKDSVEKMVDNKKVSLTVTENADSMVIMIDKVKN